MTHLKSTAVGLALAAALTLPTAARATTVALPSASEQTELLSIFTTADRLHDECENALEVQDDSSIGAYCTMSAQQYGRSAIKLLKYPQLTSDWRTFRFLMASDLLHAAEARSRYNRPQAFAQATSALAILKDLANRGETNLDSAIFVARRIIRECDATRN